MENLFLLFFLKKRIAKHVEEKKKLNKNQMKFLLCLCAHETFTVCSLDPLDSIPHIHWKCLENYFIFVRRLSDIPFITHSIHVNNQIGFRQIPRAITLKAIAMCVTEEDTNTHLCWLCGWEQQHPAIDFHSTFCPDFLFSHARHAVAENFVNYFEIEIQKIDRQTHPCTENGKKKCWELEMGWQGGMTTAKKYFRNSVCSCVGRL